jgi:hypothetical protein
MLPRAPRSTKIADMPLLPTSILSPNLWPGRSWGERNSVRGKVYFLIQYEQQFVRFYESYGGDYVIDELLFDMAMHRGFENGCIQHSKRMLHS